ncbi:F0F1 ATP synthase subunit epsilon [Paracoccus sp. p4-l81]|uniref:F0F1 ATP synthase subunit epsilon n=1 Tax=unclassified Paracoccus (in: a-proteobacteria) TaxID=2688777 RepID=UPI0035BACEFF
MADTMQFDLVSPERSLDARPVREVRLPGTDGDLTAMPGHAPMILTLRPGVVTVIGADGQASDFVVTGGFAEIAQDGVTLLAERGHAKAEMTQAIYSSMVAEARAAHAAHKERGADANIVDAAAKLLADMVAVGTHIGLDPNHANFID